jgi:hypothetical protein
MNKEKEIFKKKCAEILLKHLYSEIGPDKLLESLWKLHRKEAKMYGERRTI